jgi:hypothetical protein
MCYKIIKHIVLGPLDQTSLFPWKGNFSSGIKYFGQFKYCSFDYTINVLVEVQYIMLYLLSDIFGCCHIIAAITASPRG